MSYLRIMEGMTMESAIIVEAADVVKEQEGQRISHLSSRGERQKDLGGPDVRSLLFLATDHPSMAELLFYALGTHYQLTRSPHRARDLLWLDQLRTCEPRPAVVLLEVDCLWNEEWTAFIRDLGLACSQWGVTQPLLVINDYHGTGGWSLGLYAQTLLD